MSRRRTGLVVPMPALDLVVGPYRRAWDPVAAQGARAHVTVLFPFAPFDAVDASLLDRVAATVAAVARFPVAFTRLGRFPGPVLYLAPEPSAPFRDLSAALTSAFPSFPPYGGAFADVIPHLTIAQHPDAPVDTIGSEVARALPVATTADAVELWAQGDDDRWTARATFPLRD